MKQILAILLVAMLLAVSCTLIACNQDRHPNQPDPTDDNYRVFYQIFVGSFSDSNNDGIGDLRGIINRFD